MKMSPIVVWQMKPVWGLPNPSPFCLKLETWLRMAHLPYVTRAIDGPPKSASAKVPYIERPDGSLLADSSVIIETLAAERDVDLDAGLSQNERAIGVLVQRTFEEELYFHAVHDRWVEDAAWKEVSSAYFGDFPWAMRALVLPIVRRKVVASAHGQGVSRLTAAQRTQKARRSLAAIAQVLADKPFFFTNPSTLDAIAYGFLANMIWVPLDTELRKVAREHANLVDFCVRMRAAYWADWKA